MSRHVSLTVSIFLWLVGLGVVSAAAADWLSDPATSEMLWPNDINGTVVRLLGGSNPKNAIGQERPRLSPSSVAVRLTAVCGLVIMAATLIRGRVALSSIIQIFFRHTGLIWLAAGIPVLVQPLLPNTAVLIMPAILSLLVGLTVWQFAAAIFDLKGTEAVQHTRIAWALLLTVSFGWILISFWLNQRLYTNLLIPHGDSAMYEEHLWNIRHGKGFRSYLDQGLFLGEHIQVIHLLLLPLHTLWPSHLLLELSESVALGSCTIPLFLIARRHSGNDIAACSLALAWLFYFPMHFLDIAVDLKSFRPICLGLPFLFWMIQTAETGRFRTAWLFLLLALSAKEDVALVTGPVAAVLAFWPDLGESRNSSTRRWGIAAASVSAVWLLAAVLLVIPAFRAGDTVHYSRYFGDLGNSPGELLRTTLTQPARVLAQFFSIRTLLYVCVLCAPLSFIVVRSTRLMMSSLLTFLMLSLLQLGGGPDGGNLPPVPYHHFHAPLLPVFFWAAASALGERVAGPGRRSLRLFPSSPRSKSLLVLCCCATAGVTGSLLPYGAGFWSETSPFGRHALYFPRPHHPVENRLIERAAMAERVEQIIPRTARVASTDFIHTRLTHWKRSYDYSDYERSVNESGQRVPADAEYIVIDTRHRYSSIRRWDQVPELRESEDWELLPDETNGYFLILRRRDSTKDTTGQR